MGCMTCASICSNLYFKDDNPAKSRIQVQDLPDAAFHLLVCDQECMACVRECPTKAIYRAKSGALVIDAKKCVGCLACVAACPIGAMRWYPGMATTFKCIACGVCAKACPKQALEIVIREGAEA